MRKIFIIALVLFSLFYIDLIDNKAVAQFQFAVIPCQTEQEVLDLIDSVFLDGVDGNAIQNISFSGDPTSVGYFYNAYFTGFSKPIGIIMTSGSSNDAENSNICYTGQNASTNNNGVEGDQDLTDIGNAASHDGCIIEFDFRPTSDTVSFNYVFASEEYHDYVNAGVNDSFGFFLSGAGLSGPYTNDAINIALVPHTHTPVSINTVNFGPGGQTCNGKPSGCVNCQYFKDNSQSSDPAFSQFVYDGLTTALTAKSETQQCEWYHIKLAIGDGGDAIWDSGVLLEKGSFDPGNVQENTLYSHPTIDSMLYESCKNHDAVLYYSVNSPRADPYIIPYTVAGSATPQVDYTLITTGHEDSIYIAAGSLYDSLIIRPFWDDSIEGIEDVQIRYSPVMCGFSVPDTTFVYISDVPAFPDTNLFFPTYCEDTVVVGFNGLLQGIPPYKYLWTAGGQTTSTMQYVITGSDSVFLHCSITDTCGYHVSDTAFVIVPNLVTDAGSDKSLCNQPNVQLDGTSPGAQEFFWTSNPPDPSLVGQENDSTPTVSPAQTTEYILLATDHCTNSDDDTTLVNLDGAVANAGSDAEICLLDSVFLSCNIGSTGEAYIWSSIPIDAGLSAQDTNQTIKISPLTDTKYFVEVTDACDYKATDSVNVVVFTLPVANAGNDDEVCLGSSYNLEALAGGVHYQWGTIPNDPSLLVNQQDTTINPIVTPDTETNYHYYVEVTNQNGCTATDTMVLAVNYVPNIQLSPDADTICFGNSVTLTAMGDVADSYAWTADPYDGTIVNLNQNSITVTPDTTTTYFLTATVGGINCPATPTRQIIVIPQLTTAFEIANNKIQTCENEAVGVYYTGNATVNAVYSWNFDNNSIINSGSGFASDPYSIQWTTEGSKTISLSLTENGCPSDTSTIDVTVFAIPITDFSALPESGCAALDVSFTNLSTNLDNPQYEWNIDGVIVNDFEAIHTFENAGTYSISLTTTNQNICSATELKANQITVFELPATNFEATPTETIVDDGVINFTNNTTSQDIATYSWHFGDGDSATVANPVHKYNAEGVYTVVLVATTLPGCQLSFNSDIIVHPNFSVYPPNAFTPNGDGENDKFEVKGVGVSSYSIRIFSRWGELVFESKNLEDSWDGTYKGKMVTTGTYVYKINYRSMLDNEYVINGTVTVVR